MDVEDDEPNHEHMINETMFKFEEYEMVHYLLFHVCCITNVLRLEIRELRDYQYAVSISIEIP